MRPESSFHGSGRPPYGCGRLESSSGSYLFYFLAMLWQKTPAFNNRGSRRHCFTQRRHNFFFFFLQKPGFTEGGSPTERCCSSRESRVAVSSGYVSDSQVWMHRERSRASPGRGVHAQQTLKSGFRRTRQIINQHAAGKHSHPASPSDLQTMTSSSCLI